jgi:hypothetical protein
VTDHRRRLTDLRIDLERVRLFPDQPEQLMEIDRLRSIYSHSISGVYLANSLLPIREFTCLAFAFGLVNSPGYTRLLAQRVRPVISQALVTEVLSESVEIPASAATNGTIAVYPVGGEVVHAGIVQNGRIRSKWGTNYVWDHAAFEVPLEYGWTVRYFDVPEAERIGVLFDVHAAGQLPL